MNTILTDDEIDALDGSMCGAREFHRNFARAIEAAVLAKLREQEPVAMRYDFDGYGYRYIDSGSGSDWRTRIPDAEEVYAAPLPAVVQATDVNDWFLSLPEGRQNVLREDKWSLAAAAFDAGKKFALPAVVQVPRDLPSARDYAERGTMAVTADWMAGWDAARKYVNTAAALAPRASTMNRWTERWYGSGPDRGWSIWEMTTSTHGDRVAYVGEGEHSEHLTALIVQKHNESLAAAPEAPAQGLHQQIEQARQNVAQWPQWMKDGTSAAELRLPEAPASAVVRVPQELLRSALREDAGEVVWVNNGPRGSESTDCTACGARNADGWGETVDHRDGCTYVEKIEAIKKLRDMLAAPEAPAQGTWFQRNAVFVITEAYEAGVGKGMQAAKRGEEVQNPWGDEPCREAWALGYEEGKKRYRPEAQPSVPAPWREAVKVARDKFIGSGDFQELAYEHADAALKASGSYALFEFTPDQLDRFFRAAIAQLDALEGGE